MAIKVAIVGATGNVGRELLNIMDERDFPAAEVYALASRRSKGREVSFGDKTLKCEVLDDFDFSKVDVVLMSAGGTLSKQWAEKIGKQGAIVIDNSSAWRMDPDVPLVVPEVNGEDVLGYDKKMIIANPNCSTAQLVMALKPLHDAAKIKRCVVSTYQSVSGSGKAGMDELWNQTKGIFVNDAPEPEEYPRQIAFNAIPMIGSFREDGFTDEEAKMWNETHKMIDPNIKLTVTCVRVPVFVGHSESVNIEFENPITPEEAREALRNFEGVQVIDNPEEDQYITPVECKGEWDTFVSRIRVDNTVEHGLSLWVVADNLRKGAALNTVQIAEELIKRGVLKA
ncbi:MAG: aspartate-semialdehyde dehydrogenase [Henriciella sp.]|jgi:aspartate-semialdehyde dehydrogenase|uniref:aspartate-semialdehyde dehydrogenase n=1 Tax=Henriciella sp. TaxID=1968823 RepID=UPI000C107BE9|nr:aspartate-semialdehyde dehydrogenase [Henriciella sp.]MAN75084.1 aspartate-semialdehyde dehydrogenase [Henriciella sp.]MBF33719.1 aspartate-semialdehyde dehydrogenase [Hyphomonadaceae bacterium]PHR80671.1 MAG: aspartate-semialdehyde dehydrogenase [Henriciella sp.]|tara:strand:+ start:589 stop:1608 length:1020 start_codon:yes stop_codon:yes gene_type:complete